VLVLSLTLLVLGLIENARHQRRLRTIPLRIHVNGTRGKSTTTRLIAGILRQAGYRVIAKTTGTAARLILEDGSEVHIQRRKKASIIEQMKIVAEAARRKANVLVIECMAVHPEMQWVSEQRILQSTVGVITNVREDHLDVMGPTLQDVASALAMSIPKSGMLVVGEAGFLDFFQDEARRLDTVTYLADRSVVEDGDLDTFSYMMFEGNIACALTVSELLGIPRSVAWEGMARVKPDLGSTQVYRMEHSGLNLYFVNALAANDLLSTKLVWERWRDMSAQWSLDDAPVIGLLHNRPDRSFRVTELVSVAASAIPFDSLWLTGGLVPVTKRYLRKHGYNLRRVASHPKPSPDVILEHISNQYKGDVVLFAYGNTQGFGQQLVDYFDRNGERAINDLTSHRVRSSR
jgi:poly-gamma-glutamate synthase PgsB/CapB